MTPDKDSLFVALLRDDLTEEQIDAVLTIMKRICHECWDEYTPCTCRRDE
jgi:hypothetical protein